MDQESKTQATPADEAGSQLLEAILLILAAAGKASVKELCALLKSSAFRDRSGSAPPTANAGPPAAPSPITEEERRRQVREMVEAAIRRLEVQGGCRATGQGLAKWVRIVSPLPPELQRRMAALEAAENAAVNAALQVLGDGRPHSAHELGSALADSAELSNVVTRKLLGERVLSRIGESPGVVSRWESADGISTRWFERRLAGGDGANPPGVAAGPAAPGQTVVVRIPIDQIDVPAGGRKKLLNIDELANSIGLVGLLADVLVVRDAATGRYQLVAGRRRLEACKLRGDAEIACKVLPLDGLKAELAGLDDELQRQDLTALERAEKWKRRQEIYEALHPSAVRPRGGRRPRNGETVSPFSDDYAAKAGMTQRSIQQETQIAKKLTDETKDIIRGTEVENRKRSLLELARMEPMEQLDAARRMVGAAAESADGTTADGDETRTDIAGAKPYRPAPDVQELKSDLRGVVSVLTRCEESYSNLPPADRRSLSASLRRIRAIADRMLALPTVVEVAAEVAAAT